MSHDLAAEVAGDARGRSNQETVDGGECPFCRIANGQAEAEIVYADAQAVAFLDVHPQAPRHALVILRRHIEGLDDLTAAREGEAGLADEPSGTAEALSGHLLWVAARVAQQLGLGGSGYRVVVNTGRDAGQTIHHLHLHVLGGRVMRWPPG